MGADEGLRDRLVATGVALVTSDGVVALSLREIARRAGVSHGAPRRYFPTHLELLSAIAREGFRDLAERAAAAMADAASAGGSDARAQLAAGARCYLEFALTRRGMYELMFRHDLLESNRLGLRETSLPLFHRLTELVADAGPASGADPPLVAAALWANLHGIAQLWGWGSLPLATGLDDVDPLIRAALDAHLGAP
ncbi:TetR/AcrR family transcriptional regulator [Cryptosporangium minutisporangium]|uniref:TetR/AcrR family transcriptional regulator n=1 Tax=Cryptosporangium minutisporangium TaxID=113569 RepID=A0ABP6SZI2_9ACTN